MASSLKLFFSLFGVGKLPKAPGTFGSLAAIPFVYILGSMDFEWSMGTFFLWFFGITSIFCFLTPLCLEEDEKDPSWFVMDEFLGMILAWSFIQNNNIVDILGVFILFRVFDIYKIWPSTYFDQEFKHKSGIILDDLFAAIYAGFFFNLIKNIYLQSFAS